MMEKTLRVLGGDEEGSTGSHSHSHSHSIDGEAKTTGRSVAATEGSLKSRGKAETASAADESNLETPTTSSVNGPSKLSAYLNLFGDFVHNMFVNLLALFICFIRANNQFSTVLMDLRMWDSL